MMPDDTQWRAACGMIFDAKWREICTVIRFARSINGTSRAKPRTV
jgi:hypothetical protein